MKNLAWRKYRLSYFPKDWGFLEKLFCVLIESTGCTFVEPLKKRVNNLQLKKHVLHLFGGIERHVPTVQRDYATAIVGPSNLSQADYSRMGSFNFEWQNSLFYVNQISYDQNYAIEIIYFIFCFVCLWKMFSKWNALGAYPREYSQFSKKLIKGVSLYQDRICM